MCRYALPVGAVRLARVRLWEMAFSRSNLTTTLATAGVVVALGAGVAWGIQRNEAVGDGPPELRLRLQPEATMQDGLEFLGERLGAGDHVEKITVEDRLVTVRFVSHNFMDAACALNGTWKGAVFNQEGVTFDIAAMCA